MLLLLLRHAHAGQRDPIHYPDDSLRPLTAEGRATSRRAAAALLHHGLVPTTMLSSPWSRARETAEIVAAMIPQHHRVPLQLSSALMGTPNLRALSRAVGRQPASAVVLCVGHEPWLGEVAGLLLWGGPAKKRIELPKGGLIGLDVSSLRARRGQLRFLLPPDMMAPAPGS